MLCNLLLVLTQVLTLFNGSMRYVIRDYEGGFQSPCLVLEPAHGGGNGSRSPPFLIFSQFLIACCIRQQDVYTHVPLFYLPLRRLMLPSR